MLKINDNHGFILTFENGLVISVEFGYSNCCDNFNEQMYRYGTRPARSENAEVAIYNKEDARNGLHLRFINPYCFIQEDRFNCPYEGILCYVTTDEVARLIYAVQQYPKEKIGELQIAGDCFPITKD